MAHICDDVRALAIKRFALSSPEELLALCSGQADVCVVVLPPSGRLDELNQPLEGIGDLIANAEEALSDTATLVIIGEVIDLLHIQAHMPAVSIYQHWIAIKRNSPKYGTSRRLPHQHFGVLVHTRYKSALRHTKTRIEYSYCPVCDRTTKDYGGKKHTYHEAGTLISDVWRDISCDLEGDLSPLLTRFADLFGLEPYRSMTVLDGRGVAFPRRPRPAINCKADIGRLSDDCIDTVLKGDCLENLRLLPDNSIDFEFVDPPYNLKKKYSGYSDDLEIREYFDWCDHWIRELVRVLKPGRTLALLNIPIWSVRHFLYLQTIMEFQNWIVWDALAYPVRLIMPAHYTILCFSKGRSRKLPSYTGESKSIRLPGSARTFDSLEPMADGFCLRHDCVETRYKTRINDRAELTDLWTDIHRLKHNSRRVDHPTQLPPHLLYRMISIFTKKDELVLDCFNGSGTTTLAAHQLGRKYLGIELSEKYWALSLERHTEISHGLDPFRKMVRVLTSKNSPVPRMPKQAYRVPKKTLQLEVKRVAKEIGHIPTRDELKQYGKYPIDYYDRYFAGWGEVTAAARTTGMSERRKADYQQGAPKQLTLLDTNSSS